MYVNVSYVNHVAVHKAAFSITYSLLILVEDARGILQIRPQDCLVGTHKCLPLPVAVGAFIICRGLCACTEML